MNTVQPFATATWSLVPRRTAVVVIDMQNDFLHSERWYAQSSLDISHMQAAIGPTRTLVVEARARGVPIIWTRHGFRDERDAGDFMRLRPFLATGGLRKETWGYNLIDGLGQTEYDWFIENAGKLLLGAFERRAKPWGLDGIPEDFAFGELPEDFDHFAPILDDAMKRVPSLSRVGIRKFFNGPESFTADGRYVLGPAPEIDGFFVAAGFNSIGIQSGGGAGMALAHWIAEGNPPFDLWDVDIRRLFPHQNAKSFLVPRVSESLGLLYDMHWPFRQYETSRGVRRTVLHDRIAAAGACFGEVAGWERPNWFALPGQAPRYAYSYGRQNWFEASRQEHVAVRERVGLFDQSCFAKYVVKGRDAMRVLNRVSCNEVDVAPGQVVYTQWLNARGGIESDLTVFRLRPDEYMVVTSATSQLRDRRHLERHVAEDDRVAVVDG